MRILAALLLGGSLLCASAPLFSHVRDRRLASQEKLAESTSAPPAYEDIIYRQQAGKEVIKAEKPMINSSGLTLEERFSVPEGYARVEKPLGSFQAYLRQYHLKPDKSPVLLHDGREKAAQDIHAAVFAMPMVEGDLQQCADSVIRMYGEYFWLMEDYESISFHLTNGFLMDYSSWMSGKRLSVNGNQVSWITKASYDNSRESFTKYLRQVMVYAGTLSLDKESSPVEEGKILAGDLFIRGGSPGHCIMVVDTAEDSQGNQCLLLAQGYMPAQEFHVLKNPLHEEDPWYYESEIQDTLITPEYVFEKGSLKRWKEFKQ
ncbi:DUF4846 domain-containing protein [Lacrimispora sp.]|uniref:DUF4846 domain-containing protein n=1 Tax=Lacrimispora sp. TaxID=2719234 RepID=UPI0034609B74